MVLAMACMPKTPTDHCFVMEPEPSTSGAEASGTATAQEQVKEPSRKGKPQKVPDEEWWHSDDSVEDSEEGHGPGDDGEPDALYDDKLDDKDLEWVNKQRSGRKTDAILACPGCFTTVCIDCQQHGKRRVRAHARGHGGSHPACMHASFE